MAEPPRFRAPDELVSRSEVQRRVHPTGHTPAEPREMTAIARAWLELVRTRRAYLRALDELREALGGWSHDD